MGKQKTHFPSPAIKETLQRIEKAHLSVRELAVLSASISKQIEDTGVRILTRMEHPYLYEKPVKHLRGLRSDLGDYVWLSEQVTDLYRKEVRAHQRPILVVKTNKALRSH